MKPNIELLDKAIAIIEAYPEYWNQTQWHCGTTHCVAGHVELLLEKLPPDHNYQRMTYTHTRGVAKNALKLSDEEADELFDSSNTLEDIKRIRNRLANK